MTTEAKQFITNIIEQITIKPSDLNAAKTVAIVQEILAEFKTE